MNIFEFGCFHEWSQEEEEDQSTAIGRWLQKAELPSMAHLRRTQLSKIPAQWEFHRPWARKESVTQRSMTMELHLRLSRDRSKVRIWTRHVKPSMLTLNLISDCVQAAGNAITTVPDRWSGNDMPYIAGAIWDVSRSMECDYVYPTQDGRRTWIPCMSVQANGKVKMVEVVATIGQ